MAERARRICAHAFTWTQRTHLRERSSRDLVPRGALLAEERERRGAGQDALGPARRNTCSRSSTSRARFRRRCCAPPSRRSPTRPIFGKIVQAGNPLTLDGMLYAAAVPLRAQWHVIRITGDPDDPQRSPRIDLDVGARSRSRPTAATTRGSWPTSSASSRRLDQRAPRRRGGRGGDGAALHGATPTSGRRSASGVDVARFGDDRTVIFPRQGLVAFPPVIMRHARDSAVSVAIANRVMTGKLKWGSELEFFDATGGWAAGAVDILRDAGYSPIDVQFAAPATDPRFANRRAEIWFHMAEWVQRGGALPNDPSSSPSSRRPTYTVQGRQVPARGEGPAQETPRRLARPGRRARLDLRPAGCARGALRQRASHDRAMR